MKRFLVFCGAEFYKDGGWSDFDSAHETYRAAKERTDNFLLRPEREVTYVWAQIVDLETEKVIFEVIP